MITDQTVARNYARSSTGPLGEAHRELRRLKTERRILLQVMTAAVRRLREERDAALRALRAENRLPRPIRKKGDPQ